LTRSLRLKWAGGLCSLLLLGAAPGAALAAPPGDAAAQCAHLRAAVRLVPSVAGDPLIQAEMAACGLDQQGEHNEDDQPKCGTLVAALQLAPELRNTGILAPLIAACLGGPQVAAGAGSQGEDAYFVDLAGFAWAQPDIDHLSQLGILKGMGNKQFQPQGHLTRAQFAALLDRLFNLPQPASPIAFVDVPATFWAYGAVEAAAPYMSAFQTPGGQAFEPDLDITRIEVAATIGKIEVAEGLATLPTLAAAQEVWAGFNDGNLVPQGLMQYAAVTVQLGLMHGYPNGDFGVERTLNRAEAAVLLDRVLRSTETMPGSTTPGTGTGGTGGTTTTVTGYIVGDQAASVVLGVYGPSGLALSTYLLAPGAAVTVNGQPASASSLPEGDVATVTLDASGRASAVAAAAPSATVVRGVLAALNPASGQATVVVDNNGQTQTMVVPLGGAPVAVSNEQIVSVGSLPVPSSVVIDEGVLGGSALIVAGA
jgi:hypothetical protein